MKFVPSPGPQTDAWFSKADTLLYGGQAGGGKSGLLCGLALTEHHRSLMMRREGTALEGGGGLIEELLRFHGSRDGYSGKPPATLRTEDGRIITFGSAPHLGDEQKYQGRPRDFLGIDEATQFLEAQIRFLMGWVRSERPDQRKRTILATNPPLDSTGDWVIGMFRPWLDPTHDNPADYGELRWYVTDPDGKDMEVSGPEPMQFPGRDEPVYPESRTFIPASLADNPFLAGTGYEAKLDSLPEPLRSAMRDGNFMLARQDDDFQVIPTAWIIEAQNRWTPEPPQHAPMSCLAVDPAQGGDDETVIAKRYDCWVDELNVTPGRETPTGNEVAGLVISERRNGCTIVVDMGGGYGGSTKMRLEDNQIEVKGFKGSETSGRRSIDQAFGFYNNRSEAYWRLREALDPGQDGGAVLALPPDPMLRADLAAPKFKITSRGVQITPKDQLVADLGRSPDRGDAVVMVNMHGSKLATHGNQWRKYSKEHGTGRKAPKVVSSRMAARRRSR